MNFSLFISCPGSMEYLLSDEMTSLGLQSIKTSPKGVYGEADLATVYRICLESRLANRVHWILTTAIVKDNDMLYDAVYQFPWDSIFSADKTLAVYFHGKAPFINNTLYGALRIKDAIVDYFRERGNRPEIDKNNADIQIQAYLDKQQLTLSLDLVGYSLHQRGYREKAGFAPIKENVAAGMLIRAGWPEIVKKGGQLIDPCCGSGTFLIEAALMATNTAPGLLRDDQHFQHALFHDENMYQAIRETAKSQIKLYDYPLQGYDIDGTALRIARENATLAGFHGVIQFSKKDAAFIENHSLIKGLVIANPPYGERLEDPTTLLPFYQNIGKMLASQFSGWEAAIVTSQPVLAQAIALRSHKQYAFYNGAIPVKLYCFSLSSENTFRGATTENKSESAQALLNRLKKNKQHLDKWRKRTGHHCYRLYDAECPEYAFAIDIYDQVVFIQEYQAPKEIPEQKAKRRFITMMQVLGEVIDIPREKWILKERKQQKGKSQYEVLERKQETRIVNEGGIQCIINLTDYLDTGLFLDHRLLRLHFSALLDKHKRPEFQRNLLPGLPPLTASSEAIRFLNCFCYTGTASLHAARAGAITTNVDLSKTYLSWAKDNFRLNHLTIRDHEFIQEDALQWLQTAKEKFSVIFLDPPVFSNSKRMESTLDIQRDHVTLIQQTMNLLESTGQLFFSTPFKKFKIDPELLEKFIIKDISKITRDEDFKYSPNIHHCFLIQHREK